MDVIFNNMKYYEDYYEDYDKCDFIEFNNLAIKQNKLFLL